MELSPVGVYECRFHFDLRQLVRHAAALQPLKPETQPHDRAAIANATEEMVRGFSIEELLQ